MKGEPPFLCPFCVSPICSQGECRRPWIRCSAIQSYSARYLLTTPRRIRFQQWKKKPRGEVSQILFDWPESLIHLWRQFKPEGIVPFPQVWERSWRLGGSPAFLLAESLSKVLQVPLLEGVQEVNKEARQSFLNQQERYHQKRVFQIPNFLRRYQRILLVDDFRTTGQSMNALARAFNQQGEKKIHAFFLGVSPPLFL